MKRRHEVSSKSTSKKVTFRPPPQSQPERKDAGHQSRCLVQFVAPKLIPTWSENSVFVMDQQFCAVPITQHCKNCYKLCFDKGLRGLPPKTFRWFLDEESDATTKFKLDKYKDIKNQIFKYMRKQEIELRYISRRVVLQELLCRFRGSKRDSVGNGQDFIDKILTEHGFTSIERWCRWKEAFDRLIYEKWVEKRSNVLFCTGCGNRAYRFTSNKGITYEKCADGYCEFFYKVDATFARIKKE